MHVEPATPAHLPESAPPTPTRAPCRRRIAPSSGPSSPTARSSTEMESGLLFRVLDGDALVGVFTVAYEDPAIWGELERGAHIYLHRFARAASYPGRGLVDAILAWAIARCEALGRDGLRLDTWGGNDALIAFYESRGFTLVASARWAPIRGSRLTTTASSRAARAPADAGVMPAPLVAPLAARSQSVTRRSTHLRRDRLSSRRATRKRGCRTHARPAESCWSRVHSRASAARTRGSRPGRQTDRGYA